MLKAVVVEIVKSVEGFVLVYWKVPFSNVNQLSVGVVKVPPTLQLNLVVWDVPLFIVKL